MPSSPDPSIHRIGFLGGTFDPIHQGHVSLALEAANAYSFQRVLLCPAYQAPLRDDQPFFSGEDRLSMVESVAANYSVLQPYDHEIRKQKTCYTFETLQSVQRDYPQSQVFVLIGDDQFIQFDKWKFNQKIMEHFDLLVFNRNQDNSSSEDHCNFPKDKIHFLQNDFFSHSSTEVRNLIKRGLEIKSLLHPSVYNYMKQKQLIPSKAQ